MFFEAFVPLIQGGLKSGLPHVEREAREGTFVFRVGLGPDLWRTVALSGKHSLEDLLGACATLEYEGLFRGRLDPQLGVGMSVSF